jgi:small-conductance mechanosensitive channel
LPEKQNIIRERTINEVGAMVQATQDILQARHDSTKEQLGELEGIGNKNEAMINHLIKTTHAETIAYKVRVDNFHTSRTLLNTKLKEILEYVDLKTLDKVIEEARNEMSGSWTTGGLRKGMKYFFDNMLHIMNQVNYIGNQANETAIAVYKRFHEEYGLPEMKPALYSSQVYVTRMERLLVRAEDYRTSSTLTMTEQSFVIKRFFISVVSHARDIFYKADEEAKLFAKNALAPIATEIKERKRVLDKRLINLHRVKDSKDTLESKLEELKAEVAVLERQLSELNAITKVIRSPISEAPVDKKSAAG